MHLHLLVVALLVAGCATQQAGPRVVDRPPHDGGVQTGAAISNVWYVPGRVIVCGTSAVLSGLIMTVTLGHSYDDAARIMYGGCGGPWTVRPGEVREAVSTP